MDDGPSRTVKRRCRPSGSESARPQSRSAGASSAWTVCSRRTPAIQSSANSVSAPSGAAPIPPHGRHAPPCRGPHGRAGPEGGPGPRNPRSCRLGPRGRRSVRARRARAGPARWRWAGTAPASCPHGSPEGPSAARRPPRPAARTVGPSGPCVRRGSRGAPTLGGSPSPSNMPLSGSGPRGATGPTCLGGVRRMAAPISDRKPLRTHRRMEGREACDRRPLGHGSPWPVQSVRGTDTRPRRPLPAGDGGPRSADRSGIGHPATFAPTPPRDDPIGPRGRGGPGNDKLDLAGDPTLGDATHERRSEGTAFHGSDGAILAEGPGGRQRPFGQVAPDGPSASC